MTVLEALNAEIGDLALSNKYLVLRGLDPTLEFSTSNANEVEIAKAYCFRSLVTHPDFSEDGLSITYSRSAMISEMTRIFTANDMESEIPGYIPSISDKTNIW